MYIRDMFKGVKHIVPETVASTGATTNYKSNLLNSTTICGITGFTTQILGRNFMATIEATSGKIYVLPETDTEPTSSNSYTIHEGDRLNLKIKDLASVKGDSTTAKFQALIWSDV